MLLRVDGALRVAHEQRKGIVRTPPQTQRGRFEDEGGVCEVVR